ncbi:hypothetical protein CC99x_001650 [Candidatus Berkiella cookevillensis]|uniref:Uncharacterized protein n=1 Tax=Candidatus Berkiella cookevillensis TaxID=437022 RepID=A0A0Q9YGC6_9GAMM|nr:hypothetical protein [Candidatus Berkiella cookevillensis]MCS5707602.1 hypothetical protein [Candidatus Berkiella cookevillensis]
MPRYIIDQAEQDRLKKLVAKAKQHVDELKEISRPKTTFEWMSGFFPFNLFFSQPLRQVSIPSMKIDKKLGEIFEKMDEKAFDNVVALLTERRLITDVELLVQAYPEKYDSMADLVEYAQQVADLQDDMLLPEKLHILKAFKTLVLSEIQDAVQSVAERIRIRKDAAEIVAQQIQKLEDSIQEDQSDALAKNQDFVDALKLLTELYPQKYSKHNELLSKAEAVYFSKEAFNKTALSMRELKALEQSVKENLRDIKQAKSLDDALVILREDAAQQNLATVASVYPKGYQDSHLALQSAQSILEHKGDFLPEEEQVLLDSLQTLNADRIAGTIAKITSVSDKREQAKAKALRGKEAMQVAVTLDALLDIVLGDFSNDARLLAEAYPKKYNRLVAFVDVCKDIKEMAPALLLSEQNILLEALRPLGSRAALKAFSVVLEKVKEREEAEAFIAKRIEQLVQQKSLLQVFNFLQDKSWLNALKLLSDSVGGKYSEYLSIAPKVHDIQNYLDNMIDTERHALLLAFKSLNASAINNEIQGVLFSIERRRNALALFEQVMQAGSEATQLSEMLTLLLQTDFATALAVLCNDFPHSAEYSNVQALLIYANKVDALQPNMLEQEKVTLLEDFKSVVPEAVAKTAESVMRNIQRRIAAEENVNKAITLVQQPRAVINQPWINADKDLKQKLVFLTREKPSSDLQSPFEDLCVKKKSAVVFGFVPKDHRESTSSVNDSPVASEGLSQVSETKKKKAFK